MLLNNYAIRNDNQSRSLGGLTDPTWGTYGSRMVTFYVGDNNVVSVTDKTSQPAQGLRPPYSYVLAPKEGGMSMYMPGTGIISNAAQISGLFGTATLTGDGTISDAAGGLIAQIVATLSGSGALTASVIGQLQALATLNGSGTLTAAQSALAGMTAILVGTGVLSDAQQQALGQMTAMIFVNESQASVEQLVAGVWTAILNEYDTNPQSAAAKLLAAAGGGGGGGGGTILREDELAQGGDFTYIILNSAASTTNNLYEGTTLVIVGGTGEDQVRKIRAYNGSSKIAYIFPVFNIIPDNTTIYRIIP